MNKKEKKKLFDSADGIYDETPLSAEETEMLRAGINNAKVDRRDLPPHDTSERATIQRFIKKNPVLAGSAALIAVLLIASLVIFAFIISSMNSDRPCTDDFLINLGEDSYELKYKKAVVDGVFYIDVRPIAEYAGLTVSGSSKKIKFTGDDGTYLQFEDGYDFAKVNGDFVELGGISTVTEDTCIIPFKFLSRSLTAGLLVKIDEETNVVTIHRKFYDTELTQPSDIIFSSGAFELIENNPYLPNDEDINNMQTPEINYPIDITPYLDYICRENLMIVNKTSDKLSSSFKPSKLVTLNDLDIKVASGRTYQLEEEAAYALEAMMKAMLKSDPTTKNTYVTSAYRSYSYQESLYNGYVADCMAGGMNREDAETEASTYSARPGESEHQTGLCLDFMTTNMSDLDESFENTSAFRWLSKNAHLYGFILRYPENKVDLTGYKYEPWHYRFVGREAAMEIYAEDICLEEYLK